MPCQGGVVHVDKRPVLAKGRTIMQVRQNLFVAINRFYHPFYTDVLTGKTRDSSVRYLANTEPGKYRYRTDYVYSESGMVNKEISGHAGVKAWQVTGNGRKCFRVNRLETTGKAEHTDCTVLNKSYSQIEFKNCTSHRLKFSRLNIRYNRVKRHKDLNTACPYQISTQVLIDLFVNNSEVSYR